MKKIVSVILTLCMLSCCATCFAEGTLKVGTNPEFPPFEFIGDSGNVEGIDADIITAVAQKMGYDGVEWEILEFDGLVPAVYAGQIDASIAGMTITEDRMKSVLFSEPYFTSTQVVILKDGSEIVDLETLKGKKVGVQLGTTGDLLISDEKYGVEVERYTKGMDAAYDLLNGRLDAVVIDSLPAQQFVASFEGLVIHEEILTDVEIEPYGIAVAMDKPEMVEQINAALAEMVADGTMAEIMVKYMETEETEEVPAA